MAGLLELTWTRMATDLHDLSFPTLEKSCKYVYKRQEENTRQYNKDQFVIGSAANVAEKLKRMANDALIVEIMMADFSPDQASRLKGYQLLIEKFDLGSK
ncbi:hypothetical protein [Priestia megaterium]|uniref:hypothetical protein n=1 Tax=Priestia megaterium TaxID=1404 RepID=UPI002E20D6FD|nr:hypothetical protein [Priestia megaterium]